MNLPYELKQPPPVYQPKPKKFKRKTVIKEMKCVVYEDWQKDSEVTQCECGTRYKFFGSHRHHCRMCGKIYCAKCCGNFYPTNIVRNDYTFKTRQQLINIWGYDGAGDSKWRRVCKHCETDIKNELETLWKKEGALKVMRMARNQYRYLNHQIKSDDFDLE